MENIKNRIIILIILLLITTIFIKILYYSQASSSQNGTDISIKIPLNLGEWKGSDFDLEEKIYEILETRSIIHRNYTRDGKNIFLSIVYYPETKVDFHAPESCLGGKGVQVSKKIVPVEVLSESEHNTIYVNQLIRKNSSGHELIYYFYKAGDFIGSNYIMLRLNLSKNKLFNVKKSGALVRYSTPIESENYEAAAERLRIFLRMLHPLIKESL